MSRKINILIGAGVIFAAAIVIIPKLISTDAIVAQVTEQVEFVTGRKLTIDGGAELSIFPSLKVELNDVRFANFPQGTAKDMMSMKSLALHVPWMTLFNGKIELEKFVINEPVILLETSKAGEANWKLVQASPQPAQNETGKTTLPKGFDIGLGEVAIYGGQLTYFDGVSGKKEEITSLNLKVLLDSLHLPITVDGELAYKGETLKLLASIDNLAKVISGETYAFSSEVNSTPITLSFKGSIADQGKAITGQLDAKGASLAKLVQWQGVTLQERDNAFNAFSVKGEMSLQGEQFTLSQFYASLDVLQISGKSTVKLANTPVINAELDLGFLDLNPYLPPVSNTPAEPVTDTRPATPIVWDDTRLDLSSLKQLNATLKVTANGLKAREITLGENQFALSIKNGIATIKLDKFNAYEGQGVGLVVVNAAAEPYKINTEFNLNAINAAPLLNDAIGFDKVLGKGSVAFSLSTQGVSQKQWIGALEGNLNFALTDGGVKGANLAEMVRQGKEMLKGDFSSVQDGLSTDFDKDKKTDFSSLTGTFMFAKGVGTNNDLMMASPLLRITGSGFVDLPQTLVDYRLVTGIVDTIEGQNSTDTSTGFKVPVRIKGPFHAVTTKLDLSDAVKDKAKEKVKDKAKEKLKDKLKGLFGN
ncbi:AsmA protein [Pseudoalteromonas luteoviolacea B = ATCC 29581]|nr:AsmA protein [Pseudoalteromonas luteoviolacea B = ATCC 29581]